MRHLLAPRKKLVEPVRQYFGRSRFQLLHFVNILRKCILMTLSRRNGKMLLSFFPRYLAKFNKIYSLFRQKDL